ncbi:HyaD/HybD family hydrogenase maturation endopeptidase [Veillonella sp.]|uniref:HyaD/HybD family hydrogenase maturation endopeptidase n=1 Tax=Veillonella sp. TaxID=1926307 RepID=UPI00290BCC56|nr:HyaD/HybD family hydrogenase maturation endopeptidase [Veillonella sp.]MDU5246175.1 HyaD/HybD family hydrogenase maturation endopeptidase [Veillonella sp.]MDU6768172.1 HyaD/HybD family hydrogenase maturation endopeptidase [Veillonella sp.]MDU6769704.1 HyaD/HybD family hydrogenase maturation endopeptidase [Veillonella sp.]
MTNITTEEQFGGIEYAGSESPRIDLHAIYDDYENSIVVLGVGNILLTDEGLGVHVVEDLKANYTFTPQISLIDGGTMGMELLTYMRGMKKILLIDAVNGGEAPGTIYEFPHRELEQYFTDHISVHEVGMQDILRIRAIQENPLEDAIVIGVEPESLDVGFEPSAPVQKALPEVKERVLRVLRGWGVQIEPI